MVDAARDSARQLAGELGLTDQLRAAELLGRERLSTAVLPG
jgi:hypothetical protein